MSESFESDELLALFGKVRDETITRDEIDRLEAHLIRNPEAMRSYRRFMAVCSGLEQISQMESTGEELATNDLELDPSFDWARDISVPAFSMDTASAHPPTLPDKESVVSRRHSKWYAAVTACASVAALLAFAIFTVRSRPGTADAVLAAAYQPVWAGQSLTLGKPVPAGEHSLSSGAVRIDCANGAGLLIQAPAIFSVEAPDQAFLQRGSLTLQASGNASGFQVITPRATFIDRGTRIGVYVGEDLATEIHVFEGKAETLINGQQAGAMIDAGGAASLHADAMQFEAISNQPNRFLRSLDILPDLPQVSGAVELRLTPPRSVRRIHRELFTAGRATVFAERQGVRLDAPLPVTIKNPAAEAKVDQNDKVLPRGTRVDSFLVHFVLSKQDRRSGEVVAAKGELTFARPILAVVSFEPGTMPGSLLHPNTDYPGDDYSGLEDLMSEQPSASDVISISEDRLTVSFQLHLQGHPDAEDDDVLDQFRILVQSE